MKELFSAGLFLLLFSISAAQNAPRIYNPEADASTDIATALRTAGEEQKHVLLQVGGNWCKWCIRLHKTVKADNRLDSLLKSDFVVLTVNYSKENKNPDVLAKFDYPQRFGFPVLVILDAQGERLHTQDSALLESGNGHDPEKIYRFLSLWTPSAVDPERY